MYPIKCVLKRPDVGAFIIILDTGAERSERSLRLKVGTGRRHVQLLNPSLALANY